MMLLRRLSYASLVLAFGQIVFGAIVRITGSDTMKFDVMRIEAKPGERLRVVLRAVGQMPKMPGAK